MKKMTVFFAFFTFLAVFPLGADTILLKSGASVTGDILADKDTHVVVDIGFTAIVIEKDKIASIQTDEISDTDPNKIDNPESGASIDSTRLYRTADLKPIPLQDGYKMVAEAVVKVSRPGGLGSGFFINEDGYLITNCHVIEKETKITVTVFKETDNGFEKIQHRKVKIVALNPFLDLALLKVEDLDGEKVKFVCLGDMSTVKVGQGVFAVGNPLGLERTMSDGVISTVNRVVEGLVYIQTNTDINPGNSGGPLFNTSGEVIGVTNMGYIFYGGLNFAIPANYVRHFIDNYEAFAYDKDNPNSGYRYVQPDKRRDQNKPDLD